MPAEEFPNCGMRSGEVLLDDAELLLDVAGEASIVAVDGLRGSRKKSRTGGQSANHLARAR